MELLYYSSNISNFLTNNKKNPGNATMAILLRVEVNTNIWTVTK